jgi:dTDP-4-amino-4,6-dideoxygalactose transaminase
VIASSAIVRLAAIPSRSSDHPAMIGSQDPSNGALLLLDSPTRDIRFTRPWQAGRELAYIEQAVESGQLFGAGPFNEHCVAWLREYAQVPAALTTPSGTHALELAALVLGLETGDEVIMPSFTFVSTANAVALRGAVPVFVDIRPDTLNLDERLIEQALSTRTRAIMPVHYAGVSCEMDAILEIARDRDIAVVEDAAHGIGCRYRGRVLGTMGDLGCLSFDGQKNVTCGEGGALFISDEALVDRVLNVQAKGTNRSEFLRGEVKRYEWVELGSSFMPSEIAAAFLAAQLERTEEINTRRRHIWELYSRGLAGLEATGRLTLPTVPVGCEHNGHLFYVLLEQHIERTTCLATLKSRGVEALSHYVPLHSSPAGRRLGRIAGPMPVTDASAERLVRLPIHQGLSDDDIAYVIEALHDASGG